MKTQVCAACQTEGIRTIIAYGDEPGDSHGLCAFHGTVFRAEAFENHLKAHPEEANQ